MHSFWDFVERGLSTQECWPWTGSKNPKGYGLLGPQYKPYRRAHRYVWFLANGEIPKGLLVLHTCDNPSCVNPDHLWLGTAQDNTTDMMQKGRHKFNRKRLLEVGFKPGNPGYDYRRQKHA